MSSKQAGLDVMVELALSYVEGCVSELSDDVTDELKRTFTEFVHKRMNYEDCQAIVVELVGRDDALVRINEILTLPEEPLPLCDSEEPLSPGDTHSSRRKTRTWTTIEDHRLLAGVARYGLDNWQAVAHWLGSGRNRAQCSQRWTRCLNPRISKKGWTPEDDRQLEELVNTYGDKSWTKIASLLGNRSDVQCRYHYKQLKSGNIDESANVSLKSSKSFAMSSDNFNIKYESRPSLLAEDSTSGDEPPSYIPLGSSRGIQSSPHLLDTNQTPFIVPVTPMTLRQRHAQEQLANQMMRFRPIRPNWGTCGADPVNLGTFLQHFA